MAETWPGGDPAACGCGNPDAHRGPAPVVPDSPDALRERVRAAVECLSEHDRRVAEQAWDEALTAVESLNPVAESVVALAREARPNPYRAVVRPTEGGA